MNLIALGGDREFTPTEALAKPRLLYRQNRGLTSAELLFSRFHQGAAGLRLRRLRLEYYEDNLET